MTKGWIGCDLDGTLAHYEGWDGGKIGAPIPAMVARVKEWLEKGVKVKIVTARVYQGPQVRSSAEVEEQRSRIQDWCQEHIGQRLEVTCQKDYAMIQLWDDRCVQVIPNTGRAVSEYPYPNEVEVAREWGLHPEEARPRDLTWLHERRNGLAEIERLRETVADLEATVEAQQKMLQDGAETLFGNREELYTLKAIQDQISFDKQIEGWGQEKRDRMERFVAEAEHMTDAELDAAMYDFGDAEGTFCQRYARGRAAMRRMIELHTRQPVPTVDPAEEQKMVERIRQSGVKVSFDVE